MYIYIKQKSNSTYSLPMSRKYSQDYESGVRSEQECHQPIEQYLKQPMKQSGSRYSTFDYEGENILAELKTRRMVRSGLYPSAFLNSNKWDAGAASEKDVFFFFRYADGLYVYKQDKTHVFKRTMIGNQNRDRYTKRGQCVEIPSDMLEFVCEVPPPSNVVFFD